nr:protein LNK2-like [Coffea arabica]
MRFHIFSVAFQLSNIIWGEAGECEDHIVPYRDANEEKPLGSHGDCIKKEKNQEAVDVKTAEQKKPATQSDLHGLKLQCSSQYDTNEDLPAMEFGADSWPDLSLPGAAKANEDTMEDKAAPLDNASEIFQSPLDDSEQGDFVGYGWTSVRSFEDLERIFSNEDPIFGRGSLVNADELWSSSKDVTSSPEKSIPMSGDSPRLGLGSLRSTSEHFDVQGEYLSDQNQCFTPGHEKINLLTSNVPQDVKSCAGNIGYTRSSSNISMKEKAAFEMSGSKPVYNLQLDSGNFAVTNECMVKGNKQKKLKGRKKSAEKSEGRHLQNLQGWTQTGNQFLQFDAPYAPNMGQSSSSLVFSQQTQFQGSESSHYKHHSRPLLTSFIHGTMAKQYAAMPVLSQFHSGEVSQQPAISSYEVPGHLNPSTEPSFKSLTMTQEKIEKLRRRQQMRAMLAIQKQQHQFGNQMSSTEYSAMEGENIEAEENLSTVASLEPNSPIEQDDSNTACVLRDDCSVQDSILYQLQDIVAKLDMRIRLCIRDSLFRLAQSAGQRQNASDTSCSNKSNRHEVLSKEKINTHNRLENLLPFMLNIDE